MPDGAIDRIRRSTRAWGPVRGLLGPRTGARFGFFLRLADQNDRVVWLRASIASDPRNPVRTTCFAVNSAGSGFRHLAGFYIASGPNHYIEFNC